jgi:carbon monoxide dehydrogenase subunit G
VPVNDAYRYLWDVLGSSKCVPGLEQCKRVGKDTYQFVFEERKTGPVSVVAQYTAKYEGNGKDVIAFKGTGAKGDNTDVNGSIRLRPHSDGGTKIILRQMLAPETPVPRLFQSVVRSFVEKESSAAVGEYLSNIKKALEK